MKKVTIAIVIALVAALMIPIGAEAQETSGEASVAVMSNYVWRGLTLSDSYVIQPTVGITVGGFGANMWANYDRDTTNTEELNETDITLNYVIERDIVSLDLGYIFYGIPGASTHEVYAGLGLDVMLSPSLTVYYDFDAGGGLFTVLGIGHSIEAGDKVSIDFGASASYTYENEVMGVDSSGDGISDLYNAEVSVSASYMPTDMITISPMIAYSTAIGDDAEDSIEALSVDGESDVFYGGLSVGIGF